MGENEKRPRKGEVWTDGEREVEVAFRKRIPPTRPHGDNPWSLVAWTCGSRGGVDHEVDFVQRHRFVRRVREPV